jgi:hypothetical protein
MEAKMDGMAAAIEKMAAAMTGVKSSVDEAQVLLREMGTWKPQVDGALHEIRNDISTLRQQLGRVALNPILGLDPATLGARAVAPALEGPGHAAETIGDGGRGPVGHGEHHLHRRASDGDLSLMTPPANGMLHDPYLESNFLRRGGLGVGGGRVPRPKMDFPAFDGERPKTWKRQCEAYFRVFEIQANSWVDTATMHFTGAASMWLDNCGVEIEKLTWVELCTLVCDQFGRDEFQRLLRQLFHLKQIGSVAEYIQEFNEVMHALKAHSTAWDPELFPSRFVDGLKDEIRVVVIVHQPKNLDAAVSLALLQEEALEIFKMKEPRRHDTSFPLSKGAYRPTTSSTSTTERPTTWSSTPRTPTVIEDKRGLEAARSGGSTSIDDRASALKSYRKSRGLCFVCGEKWGPGHKCATSVQLHVVQEMFDALGLDVLEEEHATEPCKGELLSISEAAVAGTEASNTFRLIGQIQKHQVLMLIDSGSSHCFVSESMAARL